MREHVEPRTGLYKPEQADDGLDLKLSYTFRRTPPDLPDRSQVSASTDVVTSGFEHAGICHSNEQVPQALRNKSNIWKPVT